MADTKKGGRNGGNSIVWSWREVDVRHCTCMSVEAGMYCGTIQVPDGEPPITGSCGTHCWDLGYVDAETGYFISKGFPVCGGPEAPPLPDPILWPEFPLINDANRDGVPPCQQKATARAFKEQIYQRMGLGDGDLPQPVLDTRAKCKQAQEAANAAADAVCAACKQTNKAFEDAQFAACSTQNPPLSPAGVVDCQNDARRALKRKNHGCNANYDCRESPPYCDYRCQGGAPGDNGSPDWPKSCDGIASAAKDAAQRVYDKCSANPTTSSAEF